MEAQEQLDQAEAKVALLKEGLNVDGPGGHLSLSGKGLFGLYLLLQEVQERIQEARKELRR